MAVLGEEHLEIGSVRPSADAPVQVGYEREITGAAWTDVAGRTEPPPVDPAASGHTGMQVEAGLGVSAHGPRIRGAQDHSGRDVGPVGQGGVQQHLAGALLLAPWGDSQQRKHPQVFSHERLGHGDGEPVVVLGHPAALRVGRHQMGEAGSGPLRGVRIAARVGHPRTWCACR